MLFFFVLMLILIEFGMVCVVLKKFIVVWLKLIFVCGLIIWKFLNFFVFVWLLIFSFVSLIVNFVLKIGIWIFESKYGKVLIVFVWLCVKKIFVICLLFFFKYVKFGMIMLIFKSLFFGYCNL